VPDLPLLCQLPIAESFSPEYLEYYGFLPLELTDQGLRVAVAGEPHGEALDDLRASYGVPLELVPVGADELQAAIRQTFAAAESVVELVRDLSADASAEATGADEAATDVRDLANQPPVIRFVNLLIREAHDVTASDVHL
jgi:type IV pilus assembly protein PilB